MQKKARNSIIIGIFSIISLSLIIGFLVIPAIDRRNSIIPGLEVTFIDDIIIHTSPNQEIIIECSVNKENVDPENHFSFGITVNASVLCNSSASGWENPTMTMKAYLFPTVINIGQTIEVTFRFIAMENNREQFEFAYVIVEVTE